MKKFIYGIFILSFFSGCVTYNLSSGKKYRNYFPVKDIHIVSSKELDSCEFSMARFISPDTTGAVQFIFPENVQQIVRETKQDLLLIIFFPNCSGAYKEVELAKYAEDNKIPYLLISDTYSPARMKDLYRKHNLKNRNLYILPTIKKENKFILRKRCEFLKKVCPDNYAIYNDELIFGTLFKIAPDNKSLVNPISVGGFKQKAFLIEWINDEYKIQS